MMWYLLFVPALGLPALLGAQFYARRQAQARRFKLRKRFEETLLLAPVVTELPGSSSSGRAGAFAQLRMLAAPGAGPSVVVIPRYLLISLICGTLISLVTSVLALSLLIIVALRISLW